MVLVIIVAIFAVINLIGLAFCLAGKRDDEANFRDVRLPE